MRRNSASTQDVNNSAEIKVVGVGGGGQNAVNRMIDEGVQGVEFISVNTDAQALMLSSAPQRLRIGDKLTKGLGAGGDPGTGKQAAEENQEEIAQLLDGADMVFVTAGLGGGTGSGAVPVISSIARDLGALTVGVVTKPFMFEGTQRRRIAESTLNDLRGSVDTLVTVPNDRLLHILDKQTSIQDAFMVADDVLRQGIQGISELITETGLVNLDFADVRAVMVDGGAALLSISRASGENRAQEAAQRAIHSALLDVSIEGAQGILFNVKCGPDMTLSELNEAAEIIRANAHPEAAVFWGQTPDVNAKDEIHITLVATGFDKVRRTEPSSITTKQPVHRPARPTGSTQPPPKSPGPIDFPVRSFDREDLDIPAFLRRARDNNGQ